jgi:ATPase subunit of ABC transporter with duplicated ATPase domains
MRREHTIHFTTSYINRLFAYRYSMYTHMNLQFLINAESSPHVKEDIDVTKKAQEQAQKKQQKEKEKQATEARKIAQSSQITPATASKKQAPKKKRVERCTGGVSGVNSEEAPLGPPKVTRSGRSITIPMKFR